MLTAALILAGNIAAFLWAFRCHQPQARYDSVLQLAQEHDVRMRELGFTIDRLKIKPTGLLAAKGEVRWVNNESQYAYGTVTWQGFFKQGAAS